VAFTGSCLLALITLFIFPMPETESSLHTPPSFVPQSNPYSTHPKKIPTSAMIPRFPPRKHTHSVWNVPPIFLSAHVSTHFSPHGDQERPGGQFFWFMLFLFPAGRVLTVLKKMTPLSPRFSQKMEPPPRSLEDFYFPKGFFLRDKDPELPPCRGFWDTSLVHEIDA